MQRSIFAEDSWISLFCALFDLVSPRSDYPSLVANLDLILRPAEYESWDVRRKIYSDAELSPEALTLLVLVLNNQEDLKSWRLEPAILARRRSAWLKSWLGYDDVGESDSDADELASSIGDQGREGAIVEAYKFALGRAPRKSEVKSWTWRFDGGLPFWQLILALKDAPGSRASRQSEGLAVEMGDGEFVLSTYEQVLQRGCLPVEISEWRGNLRRHSRSELVLSLFARGLEETKRKNAPGASEIDPYSLRLLGTERLIHLRDWEKRKLEIASAEPDALAIEPKNSPNRARSPGDSGVAGRPQVSVITSLYKGGKYIEQFMQMITALDGFDERAELIIIDANSPDGEREVIEPYTRNHSNIIYRRAASRVGIYEAWNDAIALSRGEFITNANVDDLRRSDSLALQAGVLTEYPFVDVVYQDFFYTFDHAMPFDEIARVNFRSDLPVISPHNMLNFNSPHNAPMWRRSLHDELGPFDASFKSAGDYEFWLRCLSHDKRFYKLNDPHVAYYQNPEGISTSPDSPGLYESRRILKTYSRRLLGRELVVSDDEFAALLGSRFAGAEKMRDRYRLTQGALAKLGREKYLAGA